MEKDTKIIDSSKSIKGRFVKGQSGNPSGRPKVVKENANNRKEAMSYVPEIISTVMDILRNEQERAIDRLKAAEFIANRAGFSPIRSMSEDDDIRNERRDVNILFPQLYEDNKVYNIQSGRIVNISSESQIPADQSEITDDEEFNEDDEESPSGDNYVEFKI